MTRSQVRPSNPKVDRQRAEEMERGRQVAARAARLALLERWEAAHKISLRYDIDGDRRQAWLWQKAFVEGMLIAEEKNNNDFPSEVFIAKVALGLQAHFGNLEGKDPWTHPVPKAQYEAGKEFARRHVIDWSKT